MNSELRMEDGKESPCLPEGEHAKFITGAEIRKKFGVPVAMVKRHLHASDEYFPEGRVAEIVEELRKSGWKPDSRRCFECGEWKEKNHFFPMDNVCKFCRSKLREVRCGGRETV